MARAERHRRTPAGDAGRLAGDVFEVGTFEAVGGVWWVEILRRADRRPAIAFYHPDETEARRRAGELEEELRALTAEEFREQYDLAR